MNIWRALLHLGNNKRNSMQDKMLTYNDLSERWKIKINTLRLWVMQGKLKPLKLGRLVRFSESYILEKESNGGVH
jgi:hypothetical protein